MPSMRAVLETRQNAAAAQMKQLEAEWERVRAALAEAEEMHRLRVIGHEQCLEALAEEDAPAGAPAGAPVDVAGEVPRRLKRLVERGRLVEPDTGRCTLLPPLPEQDAAGPGRPGGGS